jgi:hypothetical protein
MKSSSLQSHHQRVPDVQYAWALSKRTTTAWHGRKKDLYYFDEEEHLKRFLEDLSEYKRLRKLNIKSIEDVFVKGWEGWKRAETYLSELK